MKHLVNYKLFEANSEQELLKQELLKVSKTLKFPAGTFVNSYSASWRKDGGHAGSKMVSKTMKTAEDLGWTHEFKQSSHPTGSHVANMHDLYGPEGKYKLVGFSSYGNTAHDNYFSLKLSKIEEVKENAEESPKKIDDLKKVMRKASVERGPMYNQFGTSNMNGKFSFYENTDIWNEKGEMAYNGSGQPKIYIDSVNKFLNPLGWEMVDLGHRSVKVIKVEQQG